jgi:hypothetical protein
MVSYLLGALPAAEAERLDELSIADDEFADRLGAVENDLVDAYVRGELAGDRLERFNRHYLASPRRHEKVRLARTLIAYADAAAAVGPHVARPKKKSPPSTSRLSLFTRPAWQWGLAAAAALLLLAGSYLWFENSRLRHQVARTEAERAALQEREQELAKQLEQQRSADDQTSAELARVRERLAQLESRRAASPNETGNAGGRDLQVVSMVLAPPTRGSGQVPTITLPASADVLALELQLEANDFPDYRATLKDPATGRVIWRSGRLNVQRKRNVVAVRLPTRPLKPQNHTLELSGIRPSGASEIITNYTFKIATPYPHRR